MVFISTAQWVVQIVDEPKWKRSQIYTVKKIGWVPSKFFFFLLVKWSRGHVLTVLWKIVNRGTPRKSGFFQERGRKRVKEWGDVTFMKEWVKAMDNTKILAPADLKILFLLRDTAIWKFQGVQIKFPLYILGPVKLKISITDTNGAKLVCYGF